MSIKSAEQRLAEIAALKKHIFNYAKTKEIYVAYRKSGYSKKFLEEHREEITLHKAAKEAFNRQERNSDSGASNANRKSKYEIPTIKQLNQEYARVLVSKKRLTLNITPPGKRCRITSLFAGILKQYWELARNIWLREKSNGNKESTRLTQMELSFRIVATPAGAID